MRLAPSIKRIVLFLFALALSVPAGATAIFQASAFATLTIQSGAPSYYAEGDAFVFDHGSATFGPGAFATDTPFATVVGSNPLSDGDGISQSGVVGGHAGPEEAYAFVETDGVLVLENLTAEDLLVELLLEYSLFASASVDNVIDEDAAAEASVVLYSDNLAIDYEASIFGDALFGPPSGSETQTLLFDLLLGPGQVQGVYMLVDTYGFALSTQEAPEPSTLGIGMIGLGLLAAARPRKRT